MQDEITIRLDVVEAMALRMFLMQATEEMQMHCTVAEMLANPELTGVFTLIRKVIVQCPE